jgi:hypothetical protein
MISWHDDGHDNGHDNAHDIMTHPPAMSAGKSQSFGCGIIKDFNVSIPSSIGVLGQCLAFDHDSLSCRQEKIASANHDWFINNEPCVHLL